MAHHSPSRRLVSSCLLSLGNTFFEATIPLSVTIIMTQFEGLTEMVGRYRICQRQISSRVKLLTPEGGC